MILSRSLRRRLKEAVNDDGTFSDAEMDRVLHALERVPDGTYLPAPGDLVEPREVPGGNDRLLVAVAIDLYLPTH